MVETLQPEDKFEAEGVDEIQIVIPAGQNQFIADSLHCPDEKLVVLRQDPAQDQEA